jgi:hypothetical protein
MSEESANAQRFINQTRIRNDFSVKDSFTWMPMVLGIPEVAIIRRLELGPDLSNSSNIHSELARV